jgi:hypothetical protein
VAAVFVYRLISFWFELVVGWAAAGVLALGARRGRWAAAHPPEEAAPAPGPAPAGVPAPCAMVPPEVR